MENKKQEKKFKDLSMVITASIILLISLAVLVNMPVKTSSTNDMALIVNTQIKENIVSIDISNPYDEYTVNVNKGEASVDELKDIPTDEKKFNSLLLSSSQIRASQLVLEETFNLAEYGLDKPTTVAKIKYKDESETTLNIGNEAPMSAGIYVNLAGTSRVYLFPEDYDDVFNYTKLDYVSKDIVPKLASSGNSMNVSKLTLKGGGRAEDLVISVGSNTQNSTNYQVKKANITADGDKTKSMAIINEIKNLTADSIYMINPTQEDIRNCALDPAYATAVVSLDDGPATILVSAPNEQGYVYAMNKDIPVIYTLIASKEDWIAVAFDDIVSKKVLNDPITSIKTLSVNDSSKEYVFSLEYSQQNSSSNSTISLVSCNGQSIDVESFKNFYQNLVSCSVSSFTENKILQQGVSVLSYKFTYADTSRPEFLINYKQDPNNLSEALLFKDNQSNCTVALDYVNRIKQDLAKLASNQTVALW